MVNRVAITPLRKREISRARAMTYGPLPAPGEAIIAETFSVRIIFPLYAY
jgi:hypothetical protein